MALMVSCAAGRQISAGWLPGWIDPCPRPPTATLVLDDDTRDGVMALCLEHAEQLDALGLTDGGHGRSRAP